MAHGHLSRRAALKEELRRLFLQTICAAGGLGGLWLGFLAAPKDGSSPHALSALAEVLVPVGLHVAAGVFTGACVAWLLALALPMLKPPAA